MKTILAVAIAMIMASCTTTEETRCNTEIDNCFYGVEYQDYDFEMAHKVFDKKMNGGAPACSEVRKGNFIGRNLDWYINCDASVVIKVDKNEKHFASIGMGGCNPIFTDSLAKSGKMHDIYKVLPLATTDGVNENGVYIGVNVMPTGETSLDSTKWKTGKWGIGAAYTNPKSEKTYCVTYLVRYILDNAKSLAHAKELVNAVNWYEPKGFPHPGESQAFHWLLSDDKNSAVLEFIDNKPYFTETTDVTSPSLATIMTNFTNKIKAEGIIQDTGCGYERWDLLNESYASTPETFEGMQDLMKKVWYTKAYTTDPTTPGYWNTEFVSPEFKAQYIYNNDAVLKDQTYLNMLRENQAKFNDKSNWHTPESTLWYTTHTSVYDLSKRELHVLVHEGLDGMKDFYKADLNSTFAHPLK